MAIIPRIIPNVVDVHVRYTHGNNRCENVYQYRYNNIPSGVDLTTLANEVAASIGERTRLAMSDNVIMREVYAVDIGAPGRQTGQFNWPVNTRGGRQGGQLASNEACHVTLRSGYTGRRNKGAKSFSEFVEGDVDGNTLSSQLLALILQIVAQIIINRVGGQFVPVVASLKFQQSVVTRAGHIPDDNVDSRKTRLNLRGR